MPPSLWIAYLLIAQAGDPGEYSILTIEPSTAGALMHAVPSAGSYEHLFEYSFQPINSALEDGGGFSVVDPQKLSIYGDSPYWTEWYFERFNITDTLFSGSAALRIPYRFLGSAAIRFNEDPSNDAAQGLVLGGGRQEGTTFGFGLTDPQAGGIIPGGKAIVGAFSNLHATDRSPPPPDERRRFGPHQRLWIADARESALGHLRWAFDLDQGTRRFLAFAIPSGDYASTFEESFASACAALEITPEGGAYRVYVLGEYRYRDHLFAELGYAPDETAKERSATVFAGIDAGDLAAGLTLKAFGIQHQQLEFSRDAVDPDGEALEPYYPEGRYLTANASLRFRRELFYLDASDHVMLFSPSSSRWSNALTYGGQLYRTLEFTSAATLESFGRNRAGVHDRVPIGPLTFSYDAFLEASYAANDGLVNSVLFVDPGLKAELLFPLGDGAFTPFASASKVPVPMNGDLARILDPRYLTLLGRPALSVSGHLVNADVDSAALGFKAMLFGAWRLSVELLLKMYRGTYWIDLAPGGGYVLTNHPGTLAQPFYAGLSAQLFRFDADRFLFDLSFSALTAVGDTAFGNGVTANDLGVLSYSTADPASRIHGLAALDGDRAFITKAQFGVKPLDGLWIVAMVRHKDGEPFAFYDYAPGKNGAPEITYHSNRGSPLSRMLIGPRTDFRVDTDLRIQYTLSEGDFHLMGALTVTNALDLGSELLERSTDIGKTTRAALELEPPRAVAVTVEATF